MKVWQQKPKNVGSTQESLAEKTQKRIRSTGNQETIHQSYILGSM
jgi:hypothetical protein